MLHKDTCLKRKLVRRYDIGLRNQVKVFAQSVYSILSAL